MTNSTGGKRARRVFGDAESYVRAGGVTTSPRSICIMLKTLQDQLQLQPNAHREFQWLYEVIITVILPKTQSTPPTQLSIK